MGTFNMGFISLVKLLMSVALRAESIKSCNISDTFLVRLNFGIVQETCSPH